MGAWWPNYSYYQQFSPWPVGYNWPCSSAGVSTGRSGFTKSQELFIQKTAKKAFKKFSDKKRKNQLKITTTKFSVKDWIVGFTKRAM